MNDLSQSRMRAFQKCPRYEQWTYRDGWKDADQARALSLGTMWHQAKECYWKGEPLRFENLTGSKYDAVLIEEVYAAYCAHYSESDRMEYEVLGIEQDFSIPLVNPDSKEKHHVWKLVGTIDAKVKRRSTGEVGIMESKTTTQKIEPGETYWEKLPLDPQISMYWLATQADFCTYDVVKWPATKPYSATPDHLRKYTKKGALYANQREFDETLGEYADRIRSALSVPNAYFVRSDVPRTMTQIKEFLRDAWSTAGMMSAVYSISGSVPRFTDNCIKPWGKCSFFDCCSTNTTPEDWQGRYIKVDSVEAISVGGDDE